LNKSQRTERAAITIYTRIIHTVSVENWYWNISVWRPDFKAHSWVFCWIGSSGR